MIHLLHEEARLGFLKRQGLKSISNMEEGDEDHYKDEPFRPRILTRASNSLPSWNWSFSFSFSFSLTILSLSPSQPYYFPQSVFLLFCDIRRIFKNPATFRPSGLNICYPRGIQPIKSRALLYKHPPRQLIDCLFQI